MCKFNTFCRIIAIAVISISIWVYSGVSYQLAADPNESTPEKEKTKEIPRAKKTYSFEISLEEEKEESEIDNDVKVYFDKAVRLFEMKSFDDSIGWFNRVIEKNPEMIDAYLFRGIAYYTKGLTSKKSDFNKSSYEMDQALKNLTMVLEKDPNNVNALEYRGLAHYEKDFHVMMAVQDFSKLIDLMPGEAKTYYYRGRANYQGGYIDEAIADYQTSIEINPDYIESYRNLWWIVDLKAKYDEGLDFYNRLITSHPGNAKPYYYRGLIFYKKKEFSEALQDFESALIIEPDYPEALEWQKKAWRKNKSKSQIMISDE